MSKYTTMSTVCVTDDDEDATSSLFDEQHTPEHPYCDDVTHGCHYNTAYHEIVTGIEATPANMEDILSFHELLGVVA